MCPFNVVACDGTVDAISNIVSVATVPFLILLIVSP
jgi:hypothetical protein